MNLQFTISRFASQVTIKLFTTSFRMIKEITLNNVPAGLVQTQLDIKDNAGIPLANGLYYVVVTTPQGRAVGKLLVSR